MYINKYQALTVKGLIETLSNIKDQDTEILAIDFYNKDAQDIEGIDLFNKILIQDPKTGGIKYIDLNQVEIIE